ncbi:hypothetical protein CA13_07400 [Planctomycetes bacterium CA13]|uniref:Uncharacterized protein n=1 Tax=Novipirellula herctigrandis TaxID=2527986 RepID=A0A5C5YXB0_9BACT|nr:hypothetical protein CA13_07400 [Planctomycetes bacterium CA13]
MPYCHLFWGSVPFSELSRGKRRLYIGAQRTNTFAYISNAEVMGDDAPLQKSSRVRILSCSLASFTYFFPKIGYYAKRIACPNHVRPSDADYL